MTIKECLIVICIIVILCLLMLPPIKLAQEAARRSQARRENPSAIETANGLKTVEHDNHKWIIFYNSHGVHFEHHPNCGCGR